MLRRSCNVHILGNTYSCILDISLRYFPKAARNINAIVHTDECIGAWLKRHSVSTASGGEGVACHRTCHHVFQYRPLIGIYMVVSIGKCTCGCSLLFCRSLCSITLHAHLCKEVAHRYNLLLDRFCMGCPCVSFDGDSCIIVYKVHLERNLLSHVYSLFIVDVIIVATSCKQVQQYGTEEC